MLDNFKGMGTKSIEASQNNYIGCNANIIHSCCQSRMYRAFIEDQLDLKASSNGGLKEQYVDPSSERELKWNTTS